MMDFRKSTVQHNINATKVSLESAIIHGGRDLSSYASIMFQSHQGSDIT